MEKINKELYALLARANNINAVAGVKKYIFAEGKAKGMEAVEVKSGAGLVFHVLPERGMSIGEASFMGVNVAYMSKGGYTSPEYMGANGVNFARAYNGGLMYTCGFSQVGAECDDNGEHLYSHGVAGGVKADNFSAVTDTSSGVSVMRVKGDIREARLFGENIVLTREITVNYGENTIYVNDTVKNEGYKTSPFMILYHCNFGHPLLNEEARVYVSPSEPYPINSLTAEELHKYTELIAPDDDYFERVYAHVLKGEGEAYAGIRNEVLGIDASVHFDSRELGELLQWKSMSSGDYALGLEPANCRVSGRAREREAGRLKYIEPGEIKHIGLKIEFKRI